MILEVLYRFEPVPIVALVHQFDLDLQVISERVRDHLLFVQAADKNGLISLLVDADFLAVEAVDAKSSIGLILEKLINGFHKIL